MFCPVFLRLQTAIMSNDIRPLSYVIRTLRGAGLKNMASTALERGRAGRTVPEHPDQDPLRYLRRTRVKRWVVTARKVEAGRMCSKDWLHTDRVALSGPLNTRMAEISGHGKQWFSADASLRVAMFKTRFHPMHNSWHNSRV